MTTSARDTLITLKPPTAPKKQLYAYADYVELLCLVNLDGEVSQEYVLDRYERDFRGGAGDEEEAKRMDDLRTDIQDWFGFLKYRESVFGDFYHFSISDDHKSLYLHPTLLSQHELYFFLLLSSNLAYLPKTAINPFTHDFELLSKEALKYFLPAHAEIFVFGSGSPHCDERYKGTTWKKLKALATHLNGTLRAREESYAPNEVGDEGLDLVAWVPVGDTEDGMLVIFGQCACTDNWINKQHESSCLKWRGLVDLKAPHTNMIFIPIQFRDVHGGWFKPEDIESTILVDRVRFLKSFGENYGLLASIPSYKLLRRAIEEKEPPV